MASGEMQDLNQKNNSSWFWKIDQLCSKKQKCNIGYLEDIEGDKLFLTLDKIQIREEYIAKLYGEQNKELEMIETYEKGLHIMREEVEEAVSKK